MLGLDVLLFIFGVSSGASNFGFPDAMVLFLNPG